MSYIPEATQFLIDSHHGIYVPQVFCQSYVLGTELDEAVTLIVEQGPDHESYWEAWEEVLEGARVKGSWTITQHEGDVFAVHPDAEWSDEEDWYVLR